MINACCFFFGEHSWSRHARQFFAAWQKQEPIVIESWDAPPDGLVPEVGHGVSDPAVPAVGLGPIERMIGLVGSRRIAYVVWETTVLPRDKATILRSMDEVWVPSNWGRDIFIANGLDPQKVRVVPEGVDVETFKPDATRNAARPRFRFLFVGKWENRKGVDLLIKAYRQEFAPDEPVELVLHASNPYIPEFDLDRRIERSLRIPFGRRRTPPITASRPMSENGLVALYNSCDAFVLPTRAEGWGLPIPEAMACELPVIITAYSAPLDYLDSDIAYLIDVKRQVPIRDRYFFPDGRALGTWAEPDIRSLRRLMRHVFENPVEARAKGARARAAICANWTWDHAATTARQLLREVP